MTEQTVRVSIDGQEVRCPADWTIYQAAASAGIHIPVFCHHPKLVPVGACRTCMVEIEGVRGLQTSCTTPVREGMSVRVHTSPAAVKQRRAVLEFLLTNHPLDCPVCDKGGECPLQDQAMADGPGESRYGEPKRHKNKRYPLGELIVLDQERCVLCWRCIRFLDEWAGDHELDLFGRGATTRLDTFPGRPLVSKWQGNTIDVCPVGALTSRVFRFEARVWELTNTPSICPMCPVGCNVVLGVKNNTLRRITPRENGQVNDAWLCDKGRFAHGYVDHADRLTKPLIRRAGTLEPASWGEALDLVARRLGQAARERGPQAIAALGSTRATNEAGYLLQRLMRAGLGSNNVDHLGRFPAGASLLGSLPDLERNDAFLLLGLDPSTEAPLVELWIKKAVLRHGARVIVAHPRRIELGRYGGPWLSYLPGSEGVLLNGLARAVLDEMDSASPAGALPRGVSGLEGLRAWVGEYTPEQVQRIAGTPPGELREAARLLVQAKRPILLCGAQWANGLAAGDRISRAREGARSETPGQAGGRLFAHPGVRTGGRGSGVDAVGNLALLLGGVEAALIPEDNNTLGALEVGVVPDLLPGQQAFDDKVRNRMASLWGGRLSPVPGLGFDEMISAAQEGRLEALWVMGCDPAAESRAAGEALGRIPFLVVQDLFMSETASTAEVVLPAASFAEVDGTFVNLTGRVQAVRAALRPPGEARPDWWIVAEVGRRVAGRKQAPGGDREQAAWDFSGPADVLREVAKVVPGYRGVDLETIGQQGWQRTGAPHATAGAGSVPARRAFSRVEPGLLATDVEYPLALVTGRLLYDRGTLLSRAGRIQALVPEPFVAVHPLEADRLGLREGEEVSVVSAVGRLRLGLKVSDDVAPGVAYAPLNLGPAPLSVLFPDRCAPPRVRIER